MAERRRERPASEHHNGDDRHKKQRVLFRTGILMVFFGVVLFLPLVYQLYQLQIVQHEAWQEEAANSQTRDVAVGADRGTIYDSEGNILAISATVQNLVISPYHIEEGKMDKNLIANGLSQLTGFEAARILDRMVNLKSQHEVIAYRLEDAEQIQRINAFIHENDLDQGVYFEAASKRYYPYNSLGSHVIGFIGGENTGLYGAERVYEDLLTGVSGRVVTARNGRGTELLTPYEIYIDAQNGRDLHLTLNATIQGFAEKALAEGIEKYDIQNGGFCIVMNPKTGGILAMVSNGGYDLNDSRTIVDPVKAAELELMKEDPNVPESDYLKALGEAQESQWRNRCVNDTYEPGSTFKSVVLAAALEEGVVDLNDHFFCSGSVRVGGFDIHCSNHNGHGEQDLSKAVQNSCNPAFIAIGQRLGAERFYDYLEDFGLLNTTGSDLLGEASSLIWSRKFFTSEEGISSLATASFGQTLKITPIQLMAAVSAVVNGGHLVTPHVLDYTTDTDGNVVDTYRVNEVRQVVSEETSATVRSILEEVVATGTGKNAYQAGYRIGGKTGTSEKTGANENEDDYIVSFLGIAPADDPQVVVLLAYDTPKPAVPGSSWTAGGTYISGGNISAPMAGTLLRQTLDYLGVEKQYAADELSGADTTVPQVVGYTEEQASAALTRQGFTYRKVGDGEKVTGQIPAAGAVVPGGSQIVLYMGETKPTDPVAVPDLSGMSPDKARQALTNVNLYLKGTGSAQYFTSSTLAANQSISPGTPVDPGTVVEVTFVEQINDFSQ